MKKRNVLNFLKNTRKKHYVMIIAAAVLLPVAFVAQGTYALMTSSDSKNNQIGIMQFLFSHKIAENFIEPPSDSYIKGGDVVEKKNWVKNDGDIASFVRVKVFPVLTAQDGEVHMEARFGKQLRYVNLNTVNWTDGGDGYFYYLGSLAPGASRRLLNIV
jgi:predicted ribosomally synthesized peptide with SipW-like signal peptide